MALCVPAAPAYPPGGQAVAVSTQLLRVQPQWPVIVVFRGRQHPRVRPARARWASRPAMGCSSPRSGLRKYSAPHGRFRGQGWWRGFGRAARGQRVSGLNRQPNSKSTAVPPTPEADGCGAYACPSGTLANCCALSFGFILLLCWLAGHSSRPLRPSVCLFLNVKYCSVVDSWQIRSHGRRHSSGKVHLHLPLLQRTADTSHAFPMPDGRALACHACIPRQPSVRLCVYTAHTT